MAFPAHDIKVKRRTWEEPDGTAYRRVYEMGGGGTPPAEGDMMPGKSSAMLGPFVERGGVSFGVQSKGGKQEVVLKCKELSVRSGESGDYQELNRRIISKTPSTVVYQTVGVAATEAESTAPAQGDTLTISPAPTIHPVCGPVEIDGERYPQRFVFTALWTGPITRAEFLAL